MLLSCEYFLLLYIMLFSRLIEYLRLKVRFLNAKLSLLARHRWYYG